MTQLEIKEKIESNNLKLEQLMTPTFFVLNKEVVALIEENKKLRTQCIHEFQNHKCIYCGLEEQHD